MHHVESYDVSDAFARLVLLGRIAASVAHRDAFPDQQGHERRDAFANYPTYQCIATIQRTFSLHMTEQELLDRVGMSATSMYRRFRQAGTLTPSRLMQWVRMHEVAKRMATNPCIERVAEALGFAHAESARRTMRTLTGIGLRELRGEKGLIAFERCLAAALSGKP